MKRFLFFFLLIVSPASCLLKAQHVQQRHVAWLAVQGQVKLSARWSAGLDLQSRRDNFGRTWLQWLVRPSFTRSLQQGFFVSAGPAFFAHYPKTASPAAIRYEWRAWEELGWKRTGKRAEYGLRFREEQRFTSAVKDGERTGTYTPTFRSRLRGDLLLPAGKKQSRYFISLAFEYMVSHTGLKPVFDQDRIYSGLVIRLNNKSELGLHYIFLYQRRNAENYELHHILRLQWKRTFDYNKTRTGADPETLNDARSGNTDR